MVPIPGINTNISKIMHDIRIILEYFLYWRQNILEYIRLRGILLVFLGI